jgi:type VI protein secretion system component VasK
MKTKTKRTATKKVTAQQVAALNRENGRQLRQLQALITKKAAPRKKRSAAPKSGMTGYLVVWRHTMDDVPVGLFADKAEAVKVAKTMSRPTGRAITNLLHIDCDTPICFTVVVFENGKPVDIVGVERKDDA